MTPYILLGTDKVSFLCDCKEFPPKHSSQGKGVPGTFLNCKGSYLLGRILKCVLALPRNALYYISVKIISVGSIMPRHSSH